MNCTREKIFFGANLLTCFRIIDVAATHYNHVSAAMTQNSKVYMWGQCRGKIILLMSR